MPLRYPGSVSQAARWYTNAFDAPQLARNAAFSGALYQAAIWLYISSAFGAAGSGSVRHPARRRSSRPSR